MHMHITKAGEYVIFGRIENTEFFVLQTIGNRNTKGINSGAGNDLCVATCCHHVLLSQLKNIHFKFVLKDYT